MTETLINKLEFDQKSRGPTLIKDTGEGDELKNLLITYHLFLDPPSVNFYHLLNEIPEKPPLNLGDLESLRKATKKGLIKHLNLHLEEEIALATGVANYDIELAAMKNFNLEEFADRIYHILEGEISGMNLYGKSIQKYKAILVKNLKYVEELELAQVDWERVERIVPNARDYTLNLPQDSFEAGFPYFSRELFGTKEARQRNKHLVRDLIRKFKEGETVTPAAFHRSAQERFMYLPNKNKYETPIPIATGSP